MPLTILEFLNAVALRLGPLPDVPGLRDPLAAIVEIATANPDLPQSRLLANIVAGICTDSGNFNESDTFLLDRRSMALVSALAEDWRTMRYVEADLRSAIKAINQNR